MLYYKKNENKHLKRYNKHLFKSNVVENSQKIYSKKTYRIENQKAFLRFSKKIFMQ